MPTTTLWRALLLAIGVATLTPAVSLADTRLTVFVRNQANQAPLDGATVCVGTPTSRAAHGRRSTANGVAVFESVPDGTWTVTAWRSGYAAAQNTLTVVAGHSAQTSALALSSGSGSDPCAATAPVASRPTTTIAEAVANTPQITAMSINGGAAAITLDDDVYLTVQVSGPVTEYRVSEVSGQFTDPAAAWTPYPRQSVSGGAIRLPWGSRFRTPAGAKTVYLQLRNGVQMSNVASDSVAMVTTYRAPAIDAIGVARANGFEVTGVSNLCLMQPKPAGMNFFVETAGTVDMAVSGFIPCPYRLLAGRALARGWTLERYVWASQDPTRACGSLPDSGLAAPLTLKGFGCEATLREITLTGPIGARWQDAFAR